MRPLKVPIHRLVELDTLVDPNNSRSARPPTNSAVIDWSRPERSWLVQGRIALLSCVTIHLSAAEDGAGAPRWSQWKKAKCKG